MEPTYLPTYLTYVARPSPGIDLPHYDPNLVERCVDLSRCHPLPTPPTSRLSLPFFRRSPFFPSP